MLQSNNRNDNDGVFPPCDQSNTADAPPLTTPETAVPVVPPGNDHGNNPQVIIRSIAAFDVVQVGDDENSEDTFSDNEDEGANDWRKQRTSPASAETGVEHVHEQAPQLNRRFYLGLDRAAVRARTARARQNRARRRRGRQAADTDTAFVNAGPRTGTATTTTTSSSITTATTGPGLPGRNGSMGGGSEHTDIESELERLGIPFVEAELVILQDQEGSEEPENVVIQAEHIPTVTVCGKEMTRSTATLLACVMALFTIVVVIVPVSITQTNKNKSGEMDPEEAARQSRIIDRVTSFAKGNITDPNVPHAQALEWMLGPENARNFPSAMYDGDEGGLIMTKQRFTMALFYFTTGGEGWHGKNNFLSDSHICEWSTIMVVCNNGYVKELQFGNNNLQGMLPQELLFLNDLTILNLTGNLGLVGSILPEIGEITSLEVLDLHDTKFTGSIPGSFVNLRKLRHLDLYNNFLKGGIQKPNPIIFSSLIELRYLDLSKNLFDNSEPDTLYRLTNLEYLDISDNEFGNTGEVGYRNAAEMPSTIGALINLKVFNAANNNLGGAISPSLAKCTKLEEIRLNGNKLSKNIPSEFGQLKELKVLDLSENAEFGGTIPGTLGDLTNLRILNLKNIGLIGSFPDNFGRLMNMDVLDLDLNGLTGSIPRDIFNMKNIKVIHLSTNFLTGTIPPEVGNATGLRQLTLYENNLEGPLPPEIGNLVNLIDLGIATNGFNSTLPETLGNLVNLEDLIFDENRFTGELPTTLGNLKNLRDLHGTQNHLNGTLPSELGKLAAIDNMGLNNNDFTGTIPTELGNLSKIWYLALGNNPLSGTVPGWIGTSKLATSLEELTMQGTNLEGTLPTEWGMLSKLKKLQMHDSPLLTGAIPLEWANMSNLDGMWMYTTNLTGSVSHLCREDFENFGSQDCEDCGLEVDLEDVECECCACCINGGYLD